MTSAVIDKSVFQRICQTSNSPIWEKLLMRYQLVIPTILIEETLVNVWDPRAKLAQEVEEMSLQLKRLQPYWVDDIREMAFREIILRETFTAPLPPPPAQFLERLLSLKHDDPELRGWVTDRERLKDETVKQWKHAQEKLRPSDDPIRLDNEHEFFQKVICPVLFHALDDPVRKNDLMRAVFGRTFDRNQDYSEKITLAIQNYGRHNFAQFKVTLYCLSARLSYFLGPLVQLPTGKIIKAGNQRNSFEDEQYVAVSLLCDRLITGDREMARVVKVFQDAGVWRGLIIWIDPNRKLDDFIPSILK